MQTEDVNVPSSNEDIATSVVKSEKKLSERLEKPTKTNSQTRRSHCPMISPNQDYDSLKKHLDCLVGVRYSMSVGPHDHRDDRVVTGIGIWCEECEEFTDASDKSAADCCGVVGGCGLPFFERLC